MSLSYRVTFLCKGCSKLIIHQKVLYDTFFIKKLVKWCIIFLYLSLKCNQYFSDEFHKLRHIDRFRQMSVHTAFHGTPAVFVQSVGG